MTARAAEVTVEVYDPNAASRYTEYTVTLDPFSDGADRPGYWVTVDGETIGCVFKAEFNRASGQSQRRYVSRNWKSLGWTWGDVRGASRHQEAPDRTRKSAIQQLIRERNDRFRRTQEKTS